MRKKLFFQAISKLIAGIVLIGFLIFLPAGTLRYWNAWLLIATLFLPMSLIGILLLWKKPELLKKRLEWKEKQAEQKQVVLLSSIQFLLGFISAGISFRCDWFMVPPPVSLAAAAVFLLGYLMYAEVLRENSYLSRIVEVQDHQIVIDTGLYGIIRHPMYAATLLLFLSMPLILGSLLSFLIFLPYPFLIAKRIRNEEQVLSAQLAGYIAYQSKVRYRLIPFVW